MLGGEPGIGKTRLAAELGLLAQSDGARVLYGRCDEGLGVPYQPFVEALRSYVETASDDELRSGLGRYGNELVRLLPELPNRTSDLAPPLQSDAATEQYRLFESVVAWLDAATETTAHVLILDDLHWAASPTVLMLRHILQSGHATKLLVVGTYRDSELDNSHPLAALLAESRMTVPMRGLHLLPLGGLDVEAVEAFVELAAGSDLGDAGRRFARALHAETGGNPFFVIETVRSLVESGAIVGPHVGGTSSTQWPDDVRIPAAARDVVLRRFARLPEDAQHTLTLAAVIGPELDVKVLEEVVDLDAEPMLQALESATDAGLIEETTADRFTFAHAIIRSALYGRLSVSRRARLHARVADAVERVYADDLRNHLSELAYHYADADPDKAVAYAIQAANAALDRLAFEDAVNIARRGVAAVKRARGLHRPVPAEAEFDLLLALGKAELRSGQPGRRTLFRAREIAEDLGDGVRQAQSLLPLNRGFFPRVGRNDIEFIAALERAIEAQPHRETVELAQLLAALASELVWAPDGDRRFALSDRAVEVARHVGDVRILAHVLLSRSMTIWAPDTLGERLKILEEVRGLAEELDDPAIRFDNAFAHGSTGWEPGQIDQVIEMQEMASALAAELRQPRLEWQASSMETARRLLDGDLDEAEEGAMRTLELGRRAGQHTEAFIFFSEQMLEIRRWQDRGEDVTEFKAVAGDDGIDVGFTLARQLYDAGQHDVARAAYAKITGAFVLPPRRDPLTTTRLYSVAYLASRFGDSQRAHDVYDALLPYADLFTSTTIARPIAAHFLGMLAATFGRPDMAVAHLSDAVEAHERVRARLFLAESKLELANVILGSVGRTSDVTSLLDDVRAIATTHGARFLVRRCNEVEPIGPPPFGA